MTIVIVITMLPVVAFPTLLSAMSEGSEGRVYLWLYPAYVLATGILAYQCYGRRTEMT